MRALTESRDARAGLVAAVLGAGYLVAAFQIEPDPSTTSVVGPQVAPLVIGAAIVVCSLVLVVQALRAPAAKAPAAESSAESSDVPSAGAEPESARMSQRQVLVVSAIFAAYIVAFIPIGYLLSTFAFLVGLTTYVDRTKLLRNCIFAAVFSPAVYVLFNYGLQVQLPPGLLG
ncbi:MAG TPA: tripartite tricarboxylate transporter TctB family protein [Nocardioidaceae bacterium]|nr:tripartite tricarboxylate transporter TctB family protein [Nocardioidaceae bacterium]